jgi:inosose dehydratase
MQTRIANSPVSWGVDHLDRPGLPPWQTVFDEIKLAGYRWVELGAFGYLPREATVVRREMADRGLGVAGSYILAPVHAPEKRAEVLEIARETCAFIAGAGGRHLVIVDWGSAERGATAGRSDAAKRLSGERWADYLEVLVEIDRLAREDFDLVALAHPHAGTWLEFEDEIEALLEQTSLAMCIDTGHFAYAGADPVAIYDRHADRVPYLNFKDVDPEGRRRAVETPLSFLEAVDDGVFCPLGEGIVDFPALRDALDRHGYDGHATVEQDRDPRGDTTSLEDARRSLAYLRSVGLSD